MYYTTTWKIIISSFSPRSSDAFINNINFFSFTIIVNIVNIVILIIITIREERVVRWSQSKGAYRVFRTSIIFRAVIAFMTFGFS